MENAKKTAKLDRKFKKNLNSLLYSTKEALSLIERGANPNLSNSKGEPFLHILLSKKNYAAIQVLSYSKAADFEIKDAKGFTPLQVVLNDNSKLDTETAMVLVRCGSDTNVKNINGDTLLHKLLEAKSENAYFSEISELIKEYKADINLKDASNQTALQKAVNACDGYNAKVELLLELGANIKDTNHRGEEVLEIVKRRALSEKPISEVVKSILDADQPRLQSKLEKEASKFKRRKKRKKTKTNVYSPHLESYLASIKNKKPMQQRVAELKPTFIETVMLKKFIDPITKDYMNIPVTLYEKTYDLDTLKNLKKHPETQEKFSKFEIQSARNLYNDFDKSLKMILKARESAKKLGDFETKPGLFNPSFSSHGLLYGYQFGGLPNLSLEQSKKPKL